MADVAAAAGTVQRRSSLLPSLTTGLVLSLTEIAFAISMASLIFSGPLAVYLPRGIAIAFVSGIIHAGIPAIFNARKGIIPLIQDNPNVLLAVAASTFAAAGMAGTELFATVIAIITLTTLLTGVSFLLVGSLRLGGLVRYIPYPVIGGFLAGTGWLLANGSIGTMAAYPLNFETLPALLQPDQLVLWAPGVILGIVLFIAMTRYDHILVMPATLVGFVLLFFIVMLISGISIPDAQARGLLLGAVGGEAVWQPPTELLNANWGAILGQAGNIAAIVLLATIDLVLKFPALELVFHKDIDSNREMRVAGVSNLLAGVSGGMIGYCALSTSVLAHRTRGQTRPVLIIFALAFLFMLLFGTSVLAYLPKALIGGLLFFQGLDFLYTWVVNGRKKLGQLDYAVVLIILVTIATVGFLVGVIVGLILMIVLFVINYSRLNIFHSATSGVEITSHIERNTYHQRALIPLAKQIYVMELQGFLFFGTANLIVDKVRTRLQQADAPLSFLVLDFRRVTGLDSSASMNFSKISDLAKTHGFTMILTHLSAEFQRELARNDLTAAEHLLLFPDLDHGMEWCESTLLERDQITKYHVPSTLQLQLADNGFGKEDTKRLKEYLERVHFKPGEYLMRQGENADALYFIETGQVTVYMETETAAKVRLQTLSMGTVVGELGIYLNLPRSASVIADENTIAYRLTRQALDEMKAKDGALVIIFHELIVRLLAERLIAADREIIALHR